MCGSEFNVVDEIVIVLVNVVVEIFLVKNIGLRSGVVIFSLFEVDL